MIAQRFYDLLSDEGAQEFLDYCEQHNEHVRFIADPTCDVGLRLVHWYVDTRDESAEKRFLAVYPPNSWEYVILYFLDGKRSDGMPVNEEDEE